MNAKDDYQSIHHLIFFEVSLVSPPWMSSELRPLSRKLMAIFPFPKTLLSPSSVATAVSQCVIFQSVDLDIDTPAFLYKIVPLLSQSSHPLPANISEESYDALVNRIQFGGDEVVKAKGGAGSATLSMAYAGAEFASKILRAITGEKGIVAPTYVSVAADTVGGSALTKELGEELAFFSSNVEFDVRFFFS